MANAKKGISFTFTIWALVLLFVGYLTCWPIAESFWAQYTWDKVPCHIDDRDRFHFLYNGEKYYSTRADFWIRSNYNSVRSDALDNDSDSVGTNDSICYVKHNDPDWAVLHVDALNHLDHATHEGVVAVFVIISGGLLTWASQRATRLQRRATTL